MSNDVLDLAEEAGYAVKIPGIKDCRKCGSEIKNPVTRPDGLCGRCYKEEGYGF